MKRAERCSDVGILVVTVVIVGTTGFLVGVLVAAVLWWLT